MPIDWSTWNGTLAGYWHLIEEEQQRMAKKKLPLKPVLIIQDTGKQTATGCPLVNVHLADGREAGLSTFLSGVNVLGPVAEEWAEWFVQNAPVCVIDRRPASTGGPQT